MREQHINRTPKTLWVVFECSGIFSQFKRLVRLSHDEQDIRAYHENPNFEVKKLLPFAEIVKIKKCRGHHRVSPLPGC